MNPGTRALATLVGAAVAGVLLWLASYVGRGDNGGYWAAYGIVAAAGLVFALAQMRGRDGNPPFMLLLVFLPVLVVAGWVLIAAQPHGNWFRGHVLAWSSDLGLRDVLDDVMAWLGVLAFGIGYTLGLVLEPPRPAPVAVPATHDRAAADEPVLAERREVERERVVDAAPDDGHVEAAPDDRRVRTRG
jgi:hypothetical protein